MSSHVFQSPLLKKFQERGYIYQISDPELLDEKIMTQGTIVAYTGFDCTAPSLHVGSLIQIMMLRTLQKMGHKPIVLVGGATTHVGDPSFRTEERPMLSAEEVEKNKAELKKVFAQFLSFGDGPSDAVILDNADWLLPLHYIPFLRDYGAHVSVNRMLSFEGVKTRLEREQSLSFLEFNYMLLQAYDFCYLAQQHNCCLQMGGSDQWGNMVLGVDLARKKNGDKLFVLTSPLLTTHGGQKMGKTASGAVWLNAEMLSAYDYWQYWRNVNDEDIERFLYLFTDMSEVEINNVCGLSDKNEAKKILATQVTTLLHGEENALKAQSAAQRLFEEGVVDLETMAPSLTISSRELEEGIGLLNVCVRAGMCQTLSQVRRHILSGALKVNDVGITDERTILSLKDKTQGGFIKLSIGKKQHAIIRVEG